MPEIPNLLKTITVMILRLVTILPMIYSLEHVLTIRRDRRPMLWAFRLLMLQSVLTAPLPYLLQQPPMELLRTMGSAIAAMEFATILLMFFTFQESFLLQFFSYSLTQLVQNLITVLPVAILYAAGITSDVTSASVPAQLPRFFLTTALTAVLLWGALYLSRKLIRHASVHPKFLMGSTLFFILKEIVSQISGPAIAGPLVPNSFASSALFLIGTAAFSLAAVLMSFWYFHQKQEKLNRAAMEKAIELQKRYYQQMQAHNAELHQLQHDHKNHLFVLDTLLSEQNYREAAAYLQELQLHEAGTFRYQCGHPFVSAILQSKQAIAQKDGIVLDLQVVLPPVLKLSDVELVSIFSNLLDNAMDACRNLDASEERRITVQARVSAGLLVLTVSNPCTAAPIRFSSTRQGHGLGLQIVRQIAARYEGTFTIEQQDKVVRVLFSVPHAD